jgi:hypothetical protein
VLVGAVAAKTMHEDRDPLRIVILYPPGSQRHPILALEPDILVLQADIAWRALYRRVGPLAEPVRHEQPDAHICDDQEDHQTQYRKRYTPSFPGARRGGRCSLGQISLLF